MVDRSTLVQAGDFLLRRHEEEVRRADQAGDKAGLEWALTSLEIVDAARRDLRQRPWAVREVGDFLLRSVGRYADHPDYRSEWG